MARLMIHVPGILPLSELSPLEDPPHVCFGISEND